jgi:hypothetical protein
LVIKARRGGTGIRAHRDGIDQVSVNNSEALTLRPRAIRAILSIETFRSERSTPLK